MAHGFGSFAYYGQIRNAAAYRTYYLWFCNWKQLEASTYRHAHGSEQREPEQGCE